MGFSLSFAIITLIINILLLSNTTLTVRLFRYYYHYHLQGSAFDDNREAQGSRFDYFLLRSLLLRDDDDDDDAVVSYWSERRARPARRRRTALFFSFSLFFLVWFLVSVATCLCRFLERVQCCLALRLLLCSCVCGPGCQERGDLEVKRVERLINRFLVM